MRRAARNAVYGHAPALILLALIVSSPAAQDEAPRSYRLDHELGPEGLALPFELNSGKIYLRAEINGVGDAWMILDSGSPGILLDSGRTASQEIAGGEAADAFGAGDAPFLLAPVEEAVTVRLPGIELETRSARVGPLNEVLRLFEGRRVDGLLGVGNVFEDLVVQIDYAALTVRLFDPRSFRSPEDAHVVPLRLDGSRMLVDGRLTPGRGEPVEGVFMVDTGMRGALLVHTPFVDRNELLERCAPTLLRTIGCGIGGRVFSHNARMRRLELGPVTVLDLPTMLSRDGVGTQSSDRWAGILGSAFLQRYRATFDCGGGRLLLEPADFDPGLVDFDRSGLFLVAAPGPRAIQEVLEVVPGSPAWGAWMCAGDRIERVDGRRGLSLEEVRRILRQPAGTIVKLTLRRFGERHVVRIRLGDPL